MTIGDGPTEWEAEPDPAPLESVPEENEEEDGTFTEPRPGTILYELLVFCEWHLEPRLESQERTPAPSLRQWASSLWTPAAATLPEAVSELARCQPAWHLDLSPDGQLLAVLRDDAVEVRSARDNFTSIVACAELVADAEPQRRRLRWSPPPAGLSAAEPDGEPPPPLLAVAASSGAVDVLDDTLNTICVIYPTEYGRAVGAPVTELVWAPPRTPGWQALLLVVGYNGEVSGYHLSHTEGYQHMFTASLGVYPHGISSATYDEQRRLLVVAGESSQVGCERLQGLGSCEGITCWRLVHGPPHLQLCQSEQEKESSPSLLWLPWRRSRTTWDPVIALSLCPSSRRLLSAHRSGALTIWEFPSLRKQSHWPLESQAGHEAISPELLRLPTARRQRRLRALGAGAARPAAIAWWTDAAAILARRNGAVTVSDADSLENLLGESPEFFSGAPRVSAGRAAGAGQACLVLECERRTESARKRAESGRTTDEEEDGEEEEEPTPGVPRRLLDGVRSGLHWLTDSERFEPARRRARLSHTLYRLTCLRSTTPQQLYARKIELGEYGEALMLAEAYKLDSDLVFLKQWQKSDVCADSIRDYLGRITRRSLVLTECVSRVPTDPAAAHLLLEHGLRGTDFEAVLAAGDPSDVQFHPCDPRRCYEELPSEQAALRERAARRQLLAQLGAAQLTGDQRQVVEYRRRLLGYRERLKTYLRLVEGAGRPYDPAEYRRFRDRTALEAALEFAHDSDWEALQVMLRYHGSQLASHRLLLLYHIPETTEPALYAPLLPELDSADRVRPLETERWEDADWVDSLILDDESPKHRPTEADCPAYATPSRELTADQVSAWYAGRARDIVARTGLVGHGLDLVQLGRERGVSGLEPLRDDLDTLATLVYDAGHLEVTLDSFAKMKPERVVDLMMAGATESTFVSQLRGRLLPYLSRREETDPGSAAVLLRSYVLRLAREDLTLPALLVRFSSPPEPRPLIADTAELTALALDAVYACPKPESAAAARRMVAALPAAPRSEQRQARELLAARLAAVELLASHGQRLSVAELAEVADSEERVRALLERLCRTQLRDTSVTTEPNWRKLLDDMLEMQQKVFQVVSPQTCQEIFVLALLTSSNPAHIRAAETRLETRADAPVDVTNEYLRRLPFEASVRLVVTAASEYFDGSANLADPGIKLAKQCLQLIRDPPEPVRRELGLVESLDYLVRFGVTLLPVQVRLTADRLSLLKRCLDAKPDAYRHDQELLKLAELLHVPDSWRLLQLTAERALAAGDPAAAARACRHLMDGGHTTAWDVCRQVAEFDGYRNFDDRLALLSFSLLHCPAAELERLLRLRQQLLAAQLCVKLEKLATTPDSSASKASSPEWEEGRGAENGGERNGVRPSGEGEEAAQETGQKSAQDEIDSEEYFGAEGDRQPPPGEEAATGDVGEEPETAVGTRSPGDGQASPSDGQAFPSSAPSPASEEPLAAPADEPDFNPVSLLRSTRGLTGHIVRATASTTRAVFQATSERTRAVLQATQDGTRALVAGQLPADLLNAGSATANLLRSTVSRLAPGERADRSRDAVSANAALLRPGAPAFLADTVPGCHDSAMDVDYRSFSAPQPPLALELALAAVRLEALQAAVESRQPAAPTEERLRPLLPLLLAEDTGLALAWSLTLPDSDLRACCESWPPAELSLRAAAYCVALRLAARRGEVDLLTTSPQELITAGLEGGERDSADTTELRQLLSQLCDRLEDARQARQLLRLDRGVDVSRFATEPAYQRDTILGLAMTDEDSALETADRLAQRYGVPAAEMAREQIVYLFSAPELAADEVPERLKRRKLAEQALQEPEALATALRERVLPSLAGTDHERLLSCLTLLVRADPSATDEVTARVTLLHLLRGTGADLDRLLKADGDQLAAELASAVSAENVDSLEDLAPRLGNAALTGSAVAAAWIASAAERAAAPRLQTLEAQRRRLDFLAPADFERCAARLLFSDSALKMSLAARQEVAASLKERAGERSPEEDWTPVTERLDGWMEHMEYLEWDSYTELLESADDDVYRFARLFDQTRGESTRLAALRTQMVVEGCHLSAIRRIMNVFPLDEVAPVHEVLLSVLQETLAALRGRKDTCDLRALSAVLLQLRRYIEEDGEGLTADQVVEEFRQLCDDTEVDAGRRVKAARLLTKHFPVDRGQFPALVHADTVAALPDTPLSAADTRDAAGRAALLQRLVAEADSVDRLSVLLGVLRRWPVFPDSVAADPATSPLCVICGRALRLDPGEAGRGLVVAAAAEHAGTAALPAPAHGRLAELLAEAGAGEAALHTALLSIDTDLRRQAIERAERVVIDAARAPPPDPAATPSDHSEPTAARPWPLSESVLDSLLSAGALPLLVGTSLYGPAVAHLLDSGGDVATAASQLRDAGMQSEAAALQFEARAARPPPGHGTISAAKHAASKVFSKWLH
ncbi:neuroblastoma-amplified sequence-like [Amphibalanus amphitrite]|uniref:neuroblastoma-amplified sequence-like n=1 Tax=Amphibalanus amphitrite TaxID=1232801 RepID=UPI001C90C913|nr:neuroblastoma-amplified sequence-like [Amphibalanus amphitrite]